MPPDAMTPVNAEIRLDRDPPHYRPGERVRFDYLVDSGGERPKRVRVEAGWETSGMGDQDSETVDEADLVVGESATRFEGTREFVVPAVPWSYEGDLIKIRWRVRIVIVPRRGDETIMEQDFVVGEINGD